MSELPPQELLDRMHAFPGKFLFKVIGRNEEDFAERVAAVVREELRHDFDPPMELKQTSGGRHVSVNLEPWVESSEQVMAIFVRLRQVSGVVMVL